MRELKPLSELLSKVELEQLYSECVQDYERVVGKNDFLHTQLEHYKSYLDWLIEAVYEYNYPESMPYEIAEAIERKMIKQK